MTDQPQPWRERLHQIIFEADTPLGRSFDLILLGAIIASVIAVMLDSIQTIHDDFRYTLMVAEWGFTILFRAW